jgi:hypothetical protein
MPPHLRCSGIHKRQVTGITVAYYINNGSGGENLNPSLNPTKATCP